MICFRNGEYTEQLKNLWAESFSDSREYIDEFFHDFVNDNVLCLCEDNKVISALYYIDYDFFISDKLYKASYIYAVATKENLRGRGYFKMLHKELLKRLENNGSDIVFLIPETSELFEFYEKLGYGEMFFAREFTLDKMPDGYNDFDENYDELYKIYLEDLKSKSAFLKKDFKTFKLSIKNNIDDGFSVAADKNGYIIYLNDNEIVVYDSAGNYEMKNSKILCSAVGIKLNKKLDMKYAEPLLPFLLS